MPGCAGEVYVPSASMVPPAPPSCTDQVTRGSVLSAPSAANLTHWRMKTRIGAGVRRRFGICVPTGTTSSDGSGANAKIAEIVALLETEQRPRPAQVPRQPANEECGDGVACSSTDPLA